MFDLPSRALWRVLAGTQTVVVPLTFVPGVLDSRMLLVTGVVAAALLVGFARDWGYASGYLGNEGDGDAPVAE